MTCIVEAILQNSTCTLTNTTCICGTTSLNDAASACIKTSCSVRDQLGTFVPFSVASEAVLIVGLPTATEKYSKTTCGIPGEDRTKLVWITGVVFGALGLIVFCLRVAARVAPGPTRSWGSDDWVMTVAVVCSMLMKGLLNLRKANFPPSPQALMIPLAGLSVLCTYFHTLHPYCTCERLPDSISVAKLGLGKDMWNVNPNNITKILYVSPFDLFDSATIAKVASNKIVQVYFWDELIYLAVLPITKISILLFYLKIFPKKQVRIAIWILIGLNISYLIVFEVISIFQCTPIKGAWLRWDGTFNATCRDINMQGWASAGLNLALDLAVLILPLPELAALSLSFRKKIQILSMFCVGFL